MKVFWAWQYDLPGKISRHFIRSALESAIAQINQDEDIEEPDESFQTGMMHLDYGRRDSEEVQISQSKFLRKLTPQVCLWAT
jgi:hypothetical protein